jgi:8-oxo-dGTP pyrophosphatase MutT (NUDIX family)
MAVVGITDEAGRVLLLVHEAAGHVMLPHARVEPERDFVAAARDAAEERTGLPVEIDRPVRIRRKTYRPAADADRKTTGYDVVFRASPSDPDAVPEIDRNDDWSIDWYDDFPLDPATCDANVVADVRSLLE